MGGAARSRAALRAARSKGGGAAGGGWGAAGDSGAAVGERITRQRACYAPIVTARELSVYPSFEAAERADDEYYAALSPQERLTILLDIIAAHLESTGEASERLERVYRVTELSRS
jgi:hypothetical protein